MGELLGSQQSGEQAAQSLQPPYAQPDPQMPFWRPGHGKQTFSSATLMYRTRAGLSSLQQSFADKGGSNLSSCSVNAACRQGGCE